MKRIILALILVSSLCLTAFAKEVTPVYRAAGFSFTLHLPFSQPKPIGSGAVCLSYPEKGQPQLELILRKISAAEAKQVPGDLLSYQKTTFLGVSQKAEWTTQSTILGQSIEVGGQQTSKGTMQSCLVPLENGEKLFLALRASDTSPKGEQEMVWDQVTRTLKKL